MRNLLDSFEGNAKENEPTQLKECKQGEIMDAREINKMTLAFVLETTDFKPLANNRLFYPDLDSIGKHYLVSTVANPWIKRHYTTCNAMDPLIYDTLVKKLNGDAKAKSDENSNMSVSLDDKPNHLATEGDDDFPMQLLDSALSHKVRLCVKNYG